MVSSRFGVLLKPIVRLQFIIWVVLTASVALHVALAWIIDRNRPLAEAISPDLTNGFYLVTIFLVIIALGWRRSTMQAVKVRQRVVVGVGLSIVERFIDDERKQKLYHDLIDAEKRILGLVADGMRINLISLALSEAVIVMGLVLSILNAQPVAIVPFAMINILLNVALFPRPMELLRLASEVTGGD